LYNFRINKISAGNLRSSAKTKAGHPTRFRSHDERVAIRGRTRRNLDADAASGAGPIVDEEVAGELFKMMAGVDMVHVPYRGSAPALTDLLGGQVQVQVMFVDLPSSIGYVRVGKLRALALTTASHAEALPDLPSVADFLPGYEASAWFGIGAPRNTPAEIINKLNKEINATLADPKMKVRLGDLGATTFISSSADFGKLIADETEKWAKVIKFAGIKAD
jgi:tripartite-type tricarboxylate transporter receptor subunit TctC